MEAGRGALEQCFAWAAFEFVFEPHHRCAYTARWLARW